MNKKDTLQQNVAVL